MATFENNSLVPYVNRESVAMINSICYHNEVYQPGWGCQKTEAICWAPPS